MTTSENGKNLIKRFEGLKLKAYKDPGSVNGLPITIGYGSTMYPDGKKIELGHIISIETADKLLQWEINKKANVLAALNLPLNQNQFDACTSFIFNLGFGAFQKSTLLKKIKINPNDPTIRNEFMRWVNNDGKVMKGLVTRRKAEADLYFKP
jgi:lysozyme